MEILRGENFYLCVIDNVLLYYKEKWSDGKWFDE